MRNNVITAKCECGNKVDVKITDRLGTKANPTDIKIHAALMGTGNCNKCGSEIWIYSYIEVHKKESQE